MSPSVQTFCPTAPQSKAYFSKAEAVEYLCLQSEEQIVKDNPQEALRLTLHAIRRLVQENQINNPLRAEVYFQRGIAFKHLGQNASAMTALSGGLQYVASDTSPQGSLVRAKILSELAEHQMGVGHYREAASMLQDAIVTFRKLAKPYTTKRQYVLPQVQIKDVKACWAIAYYRAAQANQGVGEELANNNRVSRTQVGEFRRAQSFFSRASSLMTELEGEASREAQDIDVERGDALVRDGRSTKALKVFWQAYSRVMVRNPGDIMEASDHEREGAALVLVRIVESLRRIDPAEAVQLDSEMLEKMFLSLPAPRAQLRIRYYLLRFEIERAAKRPCQAALKLDQLTDCYLEFRGTTAQDYAEVLCASGRLAHRWRDREGDFQKIQHTINDCATLGLEAKAHIFQLAGRTLSEEGRNRAALQLLKVALHTATQASPEISVPVAILLYDHAKASLNKGDMRASRRYIQAAIDAYPSRDKGHDAFLANILECKHAVQTTVVAPYQARSETLQEIAALHPVVDADQDNVCAILRHRIRLEMEFERYKAADLIWGNLAEVDASLDLTAEHDRAIHAHNLALFGELSMIRGLERTALQQFKLFLGFSDDLYEVNPPQYVYQMTKVGSFLLDFFDQKPSEPLRKCIVTTFKNAEDVFACSEAPPNEYQVVRLEGLLRLLDPEKTPKRVHNIRRRLQRIRGDDIDDDGSIFSVI